MTPHLIDPHKTASDIILALFAIAATLYLASCASIPFNVNAKYKGVKVGYDGSGTTVDIDGDALIAGFKK